jgi:hypothetical protein
LPCWVCASSRPAGDDQIGVGEQSVEADQFEHDVDPRSSPGMEHGERRPQLPGAAWPS